MLNPDSEKRDNYLSSARSVGSPNAESSLEVLRPYHQPEKPSHPATLRSLTEVRTQIEYAFK